MSPGTGGAVLCWGRGEDGQLGLGDTSDQDRPVQVEALKNKAVCQIACGSGHTVVLTDDGSVYTWGRGDDGRLGHGDSGWKYVPRLVEPLKGKTVIQATCGSYHTGAVTDTGELYTWGGGMYGKLGHGSESGYPKPCLVEHLHAEGVRVTMIACGSRHTVALSQDGAVYSWGDRENGVVGHSETAGHQYLPRLLEGLRGKRVRQVAACGFHTAALTDRGEVWTWGEGKFGRLGHGTERNQVVPRMIEALMGKRATHVACGGFHSAAITETGELYTWGGGEHGQLGHGDKANKLAPCLVEALQAQPLQGQAARVLVQITCGWSHTAALTNDGQVYTFGNGDHGKLGHGDTQKVALPRLVEPLSVYRVTKVASYNEHTAALAEVAMPPGTVATTSCFLNQLRGMVNNPEFADVTFVVEGVQVRAHKAFLAARCEHFHAMFTSGMRECHESQVLIPQTRLPVFLALLDYVYTDMVEVSPENAIELYVAADLYTMDRLKVMCESKVQKGISVENAAMLLQMSDECHASGLRDICMKYVIRHFDHVSKSESFKALSRDLILDVLTAR